MKIIKDIQNLPSFPSPTVVAIGNFDGVHLGHQKILQFLIQEAHRYNFYSLVLTFYPHPAKVLNQREIKMIQTLEQRIEKIRKFNPQVLLIMDFDKRFSLISSQEFIQKIILDTLHTQEIIVGQDFHFGKKREGDINVLHSLSHQYNFKLHSISSVKKGGIVISSSVIRRLLNQGKVGKANKLLGHAYEINGKVGKGKSRGKTLGFPTANIQTENEILPYGVYLSRVKIDSRTLPALTNIGKCPTFSQKEINIESYILNFNKTLYGKPVKVCLLKKIRDEIKFSSPSELSSQIKKDIQRAKSYFKI